MARDLVRPLKLESSLTGGTQDDLYPTELNSAEDYIEAKGLAIGDDSTIIEKDLSGNINLIDSAGERTVKRIEDTAMVWSIIFG